MTTVADDSSPEVPAGARAPWDPTKLVKFAVFGSFAGACYLLWLNFRRLGLPIPFGKSALLLSIYIVTQCGIIFVLFSYSDYLQEIDKGAEAFEEVMDRSRASLARDRPGMDLEAGFAEVEKFGRDASRQTVIDSGHPGARIEPILVAIHLDNPGNLKWVLFGVGRGVAMALLGFLAVSQRRPYGDLNSEDWPKGMRWIHHILALGIGAMVDVFSLFLVLLAVYL